MTETEWLERMNAATMLMHLRRFAVNPRIIHPLKGKVFDRKLFLYRCACCRCIWHLLKDERSQKAVEIVERYADGLSSKQELLAARREATAVTDWAWTISQQNGWLGIPHEEWGAAKMAALATKVANEVGWTAWMIDEEKRKALLYDVFGNPFRPINIDYSPLPPDVITLARTIYDERAFQHMPELADALETGGFSNEDVLRHCRGPAPHVRGCWALDLILEKE